MYVILNHSPTIELWPACYFKVTTSPTFINSMYGLSVTSTLYYLQQLTGPYFWYFYIQELVVFLKYQTGPYFEIWIVRKWLKLYSQFNCWEMLWEFKVTYWLRLKLTYLLYKYWPLSKTSHENTGSSHTLKTRRIKI